MSYDWQNSQTSYTICGEFSVSCSSNIDVSVIFEAFCVPHNLQTQWIEIKANRVLRYFFLYFIERKNDRRGKNSSSKVLLN